MNTSLFASKKFRAAIIGAISSTLSFTVAKMGLGWNVDEIMSLVSGILLPIMLYIGAEGYSERDAKKVIEENKIRKLVSDQVIDQIINTKKE